MLPNRVFQILNEDGEPIDIDHAGNLAVFSSRETAEAWITYLEVNHDYKGKVIIEEIELIDHEDVAPAPADYDHGGYMKEGVITFATSNGLIGEKISGFSIEAHEYFPNSNTYEVDDEDA